MLKDLGMLAFAGALCVVLGRFQRSFHPDHPSPRFALRSRGILAYHLSIATFGFWLGIVVAAAGAIAFAVDLFHWLARD